ncbi:ATPase [Lentzea sp. JNUCC 0626]|uniref:RapZ C-terminal domain-containing protein n=1 Tax=Lentzea sp. JNUCC 0626 TaxID=3367513 RepID=UPI00374946E2
MTVQRCNFSAPRPEAQVSIRTCGSGHGPVPRGHMVYDVSDWFRDPHVSVAMRQMTARDPEVVQNVLRQPGARAFAQTLFEAVSLPVGLGLGVVRVVVFCVGGRHRGPAFGQILAARCRAEGWQVDLRHRDLDKPVLATTRTPGAADLRGFATSA